MWSCSTFYFESKQAISLKGFSYGKQGTTPPPFGFKQMLIRTITIGDAMSKIFWVYFNAKSAAIKCEVL